MKALKRFCEQFGMILNKKEMTIDYRVFEEYRKRTGELRYRYVDNKVDVMLSYYSSNLGRYAPKNEYRENNIVSYYDVSRR